MLVTVKKGCAGGHACPQRLTGHRSEHLARVIPGNTCDSRWCPAKSGDVRPRPPLHALLQLLRCTSAGTRNAPCGASVQVQKTHGGRNEHTESRRRTATPGPRNRQHVRRTRAERLLRQRQRHSGRPPPRLRCRFRNSTITRWKRAMPNWAATRTATAPANGRPPTATPIFQPTRTLNRTASTNRLLPTTRTQTAPDVARAWLLLARSLKGAEGEFKTMSGAAPAESTFTLAKEKYVWLSHYRAAR